MSTRPRLNRRAAERLLDSRDGAADLSAAALLNAARASEDTGPLPGEEAALAHFRAALPVVPVTVPVGTRIRRVLATPFAAVAIGAVVAGGGVAYAAANGHLDDLELPFTEPDSAPGTPGLPTGKPGTNGGSQPGRPGGSGNGPATDGPKQTDAPGRPDHRPSGPGTDGPEEPGADPTAIPKSELRGLCRAYQAGAYSDGKKSPAFQRLITAAGGIDQVASFCTELIGPPKAKPSKTAQPSKPTKSAKPSQPAKPGQSSPEDQSAMPDPDQLTTP